MKVLEFILTLLKAVLLVAIIGFVTMCVLSVIAFIMPQNAQIILELIGK